MEKIFQANLNLKVVIFQMKKSRKVILIMFIMILCLTPIEIKIQMMQEDMKQYYGEEQDIIK